MKRSPVHTCKWEGGERKREEGGESKRERRDDMRCLLI
jgi:hypothetical protein